MDIYGVQKLSLLDFPEKLAATIFTGGCNLRCPFCHNASLVTKLHEQGKISEEDVFIFLNSRRKKLDGICITGGEPLLQKDIADFIKKVRDLGFMIKLDTNGCYPQKLSELISAGLLDYVAIDIKNSLEKYSETVGIENFDTSPILESIKILKENKVPYEFRTTLMKEFHSLEDMENIGKLIEGSEKFFLQKFSDSGNLIGFKNDGIPVHFTAFSEEETLSLKKAVEPFVKTCGVRG